MTTIAFVTEKNIGWVEQKLGGKIWSKNGITRLYVNAGYNTKKMKTTLYIAEVAGGIKISCVVECPTQNSTWIAAEEKAVINSVISDIEFYIAEETQPKVEEPKAENKMEIKKQKLSQIMKTAWGFVRSLKITLSEALKRAWAMAKGVVYISDKKATETKVYHKTFGTGLLVDNNGQTITAEFNGVRKVVLASFIQYV